MVQMSKWYLEDFSITKPLVDFSITKPLVIQP